MYLKLTSVDVDIKYFWKWDPLLATPLINQTKIDGRSAITSLPQSMDRKNTNKQVGQHQWQGSIIYLIPGTWG